MRSHATLARLNYTTDPLPLQVARTATPGWLYAIGIATIGTTKLSDCSAVFRPALMMLREVSYSSFSWDPDHHHGKHRARRQSSALRATFEMRGVFQHVLSIEGLGGTRANARQPTKLAA